MLWRLDYNNRFTCLCQQLFLIFFAHHLQKCEHLVLLNMFYSIFHFHIKSNPQFYISFTPLKRGHLGIVALWRYYRLNYINIRRARRAPNKHYEILFVRSMPCSSLLSYSVITATGYIASQVNAFA